MRKSLAATLEAQYGFWGKWQACGWSYKKRLYFVFTNVWNHFFFLPTTQTCSVVRGKFCGFKSLCNSMWKFFKREHVTSPILPSLRVRSHMCGRDAAKTTPLRRICRWLGCFTSDLVQLLAPAWGGVVSATPWPRHGAYVWPYPKGFLVFPKR